MGAAMDAVLLAGGYGTRLRPLTYTRPKPLLPVAGRPMVEWVLDRLPDAVDRVIVAVNWQAEALEAHFAQSERDIEFVVVRETEPLGTAGAVRNCVNHLRGERLFVLNADVISDMDLQAMLDQHQASGAVGTISVTEVPAPEVVNYGVISPDPEDPHRIRGFVEKPKDPADAPSRMINAGAYLLERRVIDLIPDGQMVSMEKEIFPQLLDEGFYGCPFEGAWIDVGDPARLLSASAHLSPDAWAGEGHDVATDAHIERCTAGRNVRIGAGASLVDCVLGDDVTVAPGVRLAGCIVGDGERVTADAVDARIWSKDVPAGYPNKQVGNAL